MPDSDCPGTGKCHGPVNWCPDCGDVDLVCDDPDCHAHERLSELIEARDRARRQRDEIFDCLEQADKDLLVIEQAIYHHEHAQAKMIARRS